MVTALWAVIALTPVATRGFLMFRFRKHGATDLPVEQLNREGHRGLILALAGFSFTGLIALAVLDQALQKNFELATVYLVVSFMAFMLALNMQSYKSRRWQDDVGTIAADVAMLSMLLSVLAILLTGRPSPMIRIVAALGLLIWLVDHVVRLRIEWRYRKEL
jgi:FtsH-binding integral membrane protein